MKKIELEEKKNTLLVQLSMNEKCHSKLTLQQQKVKHEITSASPVSSIADDCKTSYSSHAHFLEILRNGSCEFSSVVLILQTSAILGVCEDAPGRSNIHYEGNLICKSEWVCGCVARCLSSDRFCFIAKKTLIEINPIIIIIIIIIILTTYVAIIYIN